MRKKLWFILFVLSIIPCFGWIGTNAYVRLCYPQSYYYKPEASWQVREVPRDWQPYFVPGAIYAITYNPDQGVGDYQVFLEDLSTGETILWKEGDAENKNEVRIITEGDLMKAFKDVKIGNKYKVTLKLFDLSGYSWSDTAVVQIQRRER